MLLDVIEAILPAGAEQWKIVAQRYQIISGEVVLRDYDDIKRHFVNKLCKKNQRQTGLNNKSGPLPQVAKAQEIQRKILINESTMNLGGDNENDEDDDDDDDDDDDCDDDCFQAETLAPTITDNATPLTDLATSDGNPKKKIKVEDGQKTKNSKPSNNNPRGGIAGTIAGIASSIEKDRSMNMYLDFQKQLREQQKESDARIERLMAKQEQQQRDQQQQMMMMMMLLSGRAPPSASCCFPVEPSILRKCPAMLSFPTQRLVLKR